MQNAQSIEQAMQRFVQMLEELRAHVVGLQATSAAHELKLKELTEYVRYQTTPASKSRNADSSKLSHTEIRPQP